MPVVTVTGNQIPIRQKERILSIADNLVGKLQNEGYTLVEQINELM